MFAKLVSGAIAVSTALMVAAAPAQAQPWGWRHYGGGWGGGWGGDAAAAGVAGLAAGAIIGGALASRPYAYGPGYYTGPAYAYGPAYAPPPPPLPGDAIAYCQSRYRSYDPVSGTFLGYDGLRHPCP